MYHYHTLPNGLRIVHKQTKSPVAHVGVIINTGSRDELPEEHGLAHFTEHVIFKGTEKRKLFQVLGRLENIGADLNAFTTKEDISVFASFPKRYYGRTIELLSDIIFHSIFPEKEIEKEKDVIIDEINAYEDTPSEAIFDDFEDLLFPGTTLGRNILGRPAILRKFNREKILHFTAKHFHPANIVLCSVGNIGPDRLLELVTRYFNMADKTSEVTKREPLISYKSKQEHRKRSVYQAHCMIGNRAYSSYHPQRTAMALLNNILGGPAMNSRLNLAIREKHGIAYNIESNYSPLSDTGVFAIYLGTEASNLEKSIRLVHHELEKLRLLRLGTIQLHTAKRQLTGQIAIAMESQQNDMLSMGKSLLLYNKVESLREICERINALSAENLMEAANHVFSPDSLSMLTFTKK
jgi:predicted Zn-dependent peptidase